MSGLSFSIGEPEVSPMAARFLAANLAALPLGRDTRKAVESATPRGRVISLGDGSPALEVDGAILGAAPDSASIRQTFSPHTSHDSRMLVVFGLGAGHSARELRARTSASILLYEPDPEVLRAILESGPCDLGTMTVVTSIAELQGLWPLLAREQATATLIATQGYRERYPDAYRALVEEIPRFVADVDIVTSTVRLRSREWIRNGIANANVLTRTSPALLTLGKTFENVPAFIVGAGPSLAKNAALLAEAAKKGLVIVVDVAGKALAKHDVEPHMMVCLEGLNLSHHMAELPFIDRVARCFSMSSHPDGFNTGNGPLLPFFEALPDYSALAEICGCEGVAVGGSVSTVAFSLAAKLGCNPIALVGQDLAYTGGRTHAEGTPFERSRVEVDEATGKVRFTHCDEMKRVRDDSPLGAAPAQDDLFLVDAYGGAGTVASTSSFNAFRMWFEVTAQTLVDANPELRLVNATEGGSRIAHFQEQSLADLLRGLPYMTLDATRIFRDAAKPARSHAELAEWRKHQRELTASVRRVAVRLQRACDDALEHLEAGATSTAVRKFDKIRPLEIELSDALKAQPLAGRWAAAAATKLAEDRTRSHTHESREDAVWALRAERDFAAALAAAARELEDEFSKHDVTPPQDAATEHAQ